MRWFKILIVCSAIFYLSTSVNAGEIVVPPDITGIIANEAAKVKKTIPIARPMLDQTKRLFRAWISPSIDLSRAQMRENKRFSRTTYIQQLPAAKLRLPTERLHVPLGGSLKSFKGKTLSYPPTTLKASLPVMAIYREGPAYFRFQKIKELKTQTRIKTADAVKLARNFLVENRFLIETEKDRIGRIELMERHINEDGGEDRKPKDYLVQQDISFRRVFEGKPVVNSIITVGLLPDTREIVLMKHFHWTPLEENKEDPAVFQQSKGAGSINNSSIIGGIKRKIRDSCGNFTKAHIKKIVPAWFQAEDKLIPVLVSVIHTEYADGYKGTYTDLTNLVGSDDIFLRDQKIAAVNPTIPEGNASRPGTGDSKEAFCRQYAEKALRQISERIERAGSVPVNDPVWEKDFNHHYNWCLQVPQSVADQGSKRRQDWLIEHKGTIIPFKVKVEAPSGSSDTGQPGALQAAPRTTGRSIQISGSWYSPKLEREVEVTQTGTSFSFSVSGLNLTGGGMINGKRINLNWTGPKRSGTEVGDITQVDQGNKANRIDWDNGGVWTRSQTHRGTTPPDISGSWYSPKLEREVEVTQTGTSFSFSVSELNLTGGGMLSGKRINLNWTGPKRSGTEVGDITQVDQGNKATRIDWDNGGVWTRSQTPINRDNGGSWTREIKPSGAENDFCKQYADRALQQIRERIERIGSAPADDPVWKKDFNHHYNWCLQVPQSLAEQGSGQRQDWLDQHTQRGALPDPMPEPIKSKRGALPDPMPKPVDSKSLPGDPTPSGTHSGFCRQYADRALHQIRERIERTGSAPADDPVWKKDFNHHYNWCLQVPQSLADQGSKQRQYWLDQHQQRGALPDPMPEPIKSKRGALPDPMPKPAGSKSLPGDPRP